MAGKKKEKKEKEIPARSELVDCTHAVAGHAGTMCDADGELFIKPCTQLEVEFYQSANARYPEFAELMPLFLGTLSLSDPTELSSADDGIPGLVADPDVQAKVIEAVQAQAQIPVADTAPVSNDGITWIPNKTKKIKTDQAVVLENASSGFTRANILDAKLGRRLWADDAPQQKKTRFDKIASETTHGSLGFRIAGMRAYRGSLDKAELNEEDYRIYDKDFGRVSVNTDNVVDAFRKFVFNPAADIDEELGKAVCHAFVRELHNVEEVLSIHESRMYSSSLLFVFEGDGDKLREAIEANNSAVDHVENRTGRKDDNFGRTTFRVDSGIELMVEDIVQGDENDDSDDEDDGPSLPKIFELKLIDFAHAQWTPGLGPDENALVGVRSLIKIFEELAA
ncbi:inositol polyphosphate multikinase [Verticillium alfalfae VaMs.102]|uniref:Kinase n=1 Tax=Verticillium alfalfae (strain VaMs.102 / ATCC MYA-4576 / FGSC 10136) TaxID=526221 RepID=C9S6H9_VERA1|nr:inositol polyphosphate multikinase [Verticillium alfalfae VaMs.102]EEY15166.1 inositol polyphosphate multikinase [Verticillium alfalfae VaMs.102]